MTLVYLVFLVDDFSIEMVFSNEQAAIDFCEMHNSKIDSDHWWDRVNYYSMPLFDSVRKEFMFDDGETQENG